jgi:S1-C subfamily serine protease
MSILEKHEKFLYPVVRIFSGKAAGSGTVIYCEKDPKNPGEYLTFILTNHHVVADLITYKQEWDSLLKRKVEKEFKERAKVEIFSYVRESYVDSSNRFSATIECYDQQHDLALLRMESPRKFEHVSTIIPKDEIRNLRLFMDVVVSGCSMAHEPFCNYGQLTFLKEIIDQKKYFMYNAGSYFGNSGGALFLKKEGYLIGVPSRLTGVKMGFGMDMVTFMGFAAHSERLYEFFDEQEFHFLYDKNDTYYEALERRKDKEKEAIMALKAEFANQPEAKQSGPIASMPIA